MSAQFEQIAIGGVDSPYIKGIYNPSKEMYGGMPVFTKKDSNEHKLIFEAKSSKWKIREKRGEKWVTIAKVLCRPPGPPQQASDVWVTRSENSRGFHYMPTPKLKIAVR